MSRILTIKGNYHLGNQPGLFQHASYVGHGLTLPLRKTWIDPDANSVYFLIGAHDIETWTDWLGHKVAINGHEIGRMKDPTNIQGPDEEFQVEVSVSDLSSYLNGNDNFSLSIGLETQPSAQGLADDFVLTRIDTANFVASVGWR